MARGATLDCVAVCGEREGRRDTHKERERERESDDNRIYGVDRGGVSSLEVEVRCSLQHLCSELKSSVVSSACGSR